MSLLPGATNYDPIDSYFARAGANTPITASDSNIYFFSTTSVTFPLVPTVVPGKFYSVSAEFQLAAFGPGLSNVTDNLTTKLSSSGVVTPSAGTMRNTFSLANHNFQSSPEVFTVAGIIQAGTGSNLTLTLGTDNNNPGGTFEVYVPTCTVAPLG